MLGDVTTNNSAEEQRLFPSRAWEQMSTQLPEMLSVVGGGWVGLASTLLGKPSLSFPTLLPLRRDAAYMYDSVCVCVCVSFSGSRRTGPTSGDGIGCRFPSEPQLHICPPSLPSPIAAPSVSHPVPTPSATKPLSSIGCRRWFQVPREDPRSAVCSVMVWPPGLCDPGALSEPVPVSPHPLPSHFSQSLPRLAGMGERALALESDQRRFNLGLLSYEL